MADSSPEKTRASPKRAKVATSPHTTDNSSRGISADTKSSQTPAATSSTSASSIPPDDPKAKEERLLWFKQTTTQIEQMTKKEKRMFLLSRGHGTFSFWPTLLFLLPLSNSSTLRTEDPSRF